MTSFLTSRAFQSLGRDSVCSSQGNRALRPFRGAVSISWARFCLFKLGVCFDATLNFFVSISWARFCLFKLQVQPRVLEFIIVSISWARFCLFKPWANAHYVSAILSFNLLGEILFVQARGL